MESILVEKCLLGRLSKARSQKKKNQKSDQDLKKILKQEGWLQGYFEHGFQLTIQSIQLKLNRKNKKELLGNKPKTTQNKKSANQRISRHFMVKIQVLTVLDFLFVSYLLSLCSTSLKSNTIPPALTWYRDQHYRLYSYNEASCKNLVSLIQGMLPISLTTANKNVFIGPLSSSYNIWGLEWPENSMKEHYTLEKQRKITCLRVWQKLKGLTETKTTQQ